MSHVFRKKYKVVELVHGGSVFNVATRLVYVEHWINILPIVHYYLKRLPVFHLRKNCRLNMSLLDPIGSQYIRAISVTLNVYGYVPTC